MKHPSQIIAVIDHIITHKIGTIRARRIARFLIGFIPTFGVFWFNAILLYSITTGEEIYIAGFVMKYAFMTFFLMTILSIAYEFCWVHRAFVLYNYIIGLCIEHQLRTGFGEWLTTARYTSLAVGIVLIFFFIKNDCWREFVKKQNEIKGT